jgi:phosphoglycerate dehydrogenase-like enzyme
MTGASTHAHAPGRRASVRARRSDARRPLGITGRPVMVTGAGSGVGRARAKRLSRLGSPVTIADVETDGLNATAASLTEPELSRLQGHRPGVSQTPCARN